MTFLANQHLAELLGLALTLEGPLEDRLQTLLEYARFSVLDNAEAVFVSQDHFDFDAKQLRLGELKGAVRADVDASIYAILRSRDYLDRLDQSFPAWAASIIRENEQSSIFWLSDTATLAGMDIDQWRAEQLHPVGLEDIWGATAYVGKGFFLTVLLPLHVGGKQPIPEQVQFILRLPAVLAPILMSNELTVPRQRLDEGNDCPLSEAQIRVLNLALAGHTEKEIALRLHRSHHTVNSHLRTIYRHYNVSSRAELLAMAIEHDLKSR